MAGYCWWPQVSFHCSIPPLSTRPCNGPSPPIRAQAQPVHSWPLPPTWMDMSLLPCDQPVNVIGDLVSSLTICHDQSRILSHGIAHAHLTFHLSESPMVSVTSHPEAATSHIAAKLAFLKFKSPLCLKPFWVPRDPQDKVQMSSPGIQGPTQPGPAWFSKLIFPSLLTCPHYPSLQPD